MPLLSGIDGNKDQRPKLTADTTALIAQLNPQPVDLRNPKALRLKTDKQRADAVRKGHPGTGMFPDKRMTDQELADTLAYIASGVRTYQMADRPVTYIDKLCEFCEARMRAVILLADGD